MIAQDIESTQNIYHLFKSYLTNDLKQEISDKIFTIQNHHKSDGNGLITGSLIETVLQEIFNQYFPNFKTYNNGQADMKINDYIFSFKKINGKSNLALNWSKNEKKKKLTFDCPVLILQMKDGKWWTKDSDFNKSIEIGFYFIDPLFCNQQITLKSNNKTDALIDHKDVYKMLCYSLENNFFISLPFPDLNKYTYTFNNGFQIRQNKVWPVLPYSSNNLRYIDLFCGIGGFHQALSSLQYECVFACDIDKNCRENYKLNYNIEPEGDICKILESSIPPFDILCAGFPCQTFSKAGNQEGFKDTTKGTLFWEILRILKHHKPRYLILENVRNIISHDKGNTWKIIRNELLSLGYSVPLQPYILSPLHFGTPQTRERAIIFGVLDQVTFPSIQMKPQKTTIESIIDTNSIHKKIDKKYSECGIIWEKFCTILSKNNIKIPRFPIWTDWWDIENMDPKKIEDYKKYKNWIDKNKQFYNDYKIYLENWLIESRKNELWTGAVRKLEWQCDETSLLNCLWTFRGSGIRVRNLDYSPTLVAMSMIPIYGPGWRFLTPRELCRLQDFPESYQYSNNIKIFYKQIGNSVNVKVIREITKWLLKKFPPL